MWLRIHAALVRSLPLLGAKQEQCDDLFDTSVISVPAHSKPTGTISTDGVSVRIMVKRVADLHRRRAPKPPKPASRKRKKGDDGEPKPPPRPLFSARDAANVVQCAPARDQPGIGHIQRGVWTIDEFRDSLHQYDADTRRMVMESMQILGVDPGKEELAVVANIGEDGAHVRNHGELCGPCEQPISSHSPAASERAMDVVSDEDLVRMIASHVAPSDAFAFKMVCSLWKRANHRACRCVVRRRTRGACTARAVRGCRRRSTARRTRCCGAYTR